jgi:hypothetical protein
VRRYTVQQQAMRRDRGTWRLMQHYVARGTIRRSKKPQGIAARRKQRAITTRTETDGKSPVALALCSQRGSSCDRDATRVLEIASGAAMLSPDSRQQFGG